MKTQPSFFHKAHSRLCNLDTKGRRRHHPKTTANRRTRTPKQGVHKQNPTSTGSPSPLEQNTNKARKSEGGHIPWRCWHQCLTATARNHNLRKPKTYPTRQEDDGLHHLTMPRRALGVRKNADGPSLEQEAKKEKTGEEKDPSSKRRTDWPISHWLTKRRESTLWESIPASRLSMLGWTAQNDKYIGLPVYIGKSRKKVFEYIKKKVWLGYKASRKSSSLRQRRKYLSSSLHRLFPLMLCCAST
jgi:hypothetical protein